MKNIIVRIVLSFVGLLAYLPISAQIEYQPGMDKFVGEWIHPQGYSEFEYVLLISKRGEYISVRMKERPPIHFIEDGTMKNEYRYLDFKNVLFSNETFKLEQTTYNSDIKIYWYIYFNKGNLLVERIYGVSSENYSNKQQIILYPNELNF